MDIDFKQKFNLFENEFNVITKLINKLEERENYYLNLLEELNDKLKLDTNDNNQDIKLINDKLDIILEYQSIIYKMNSGYIESDIDKITNMLRTIDKI